MLYRPEEFEPLTDDAWDERHVRAAIRAIVADTDAAYGGDELWPADEWDGWRAEVPMKSLYFGAAGVIWALDVLRRRGHAETRLDVADAAVRTLAAWRREPDFMAGLELPSRPQSSLLGGETGILLVAWRLAPIAVLADDLSRASARTCTTRTNELMWGVPGTMLAAPRWPTGRASSDGGRRIERERGRSPGGARSPTGSGRRAALRQDISRARVPHGLVWQRARSAPGRRRGGDRRDQLMRETAAVLAGTAVVEDGLANWPYLGAGSAAG